MMEEVIQVLVGVPVVAVEQVRLVLTIAVILVVAVELAQPHLFLDLP
jgi:hypothetical protein